jgi:hypothetical protein
LQKIYIGSNHFVIASGETEKVMINRVTIDALRAGRVKPKI